jgi:hypothetical protein
MKRFLFGFFAILTVWGPLNGQDTKLISVFFDTDQHTLRADAQATLDELRSELQWLALDDYRVEIMAHTDDQGSESYNEGLAERRAQSVWHYLSDFGITIEKTTIESFGESQPTHSNADEDGRQGNRRVDIHFTLFMPGSLAELYRRWAKEQTQIYEFAADKNVRVIADQGTQLWITGGSFIGPDGKPVTTGNIELKLREAYQLKDMIKADLTTNASGNILETGGMLYLEASANGQTLQIQNGADVKIAMPTPQMEEGMQLFLPVQDEQGTLTGWQETGQQAAPSLEDYLDLPPKPKAPILQSAPVLVEVEKWTDNNPPIAPKKPFRPIRPHEPRRESITYKPPFFKRVFMSKEARLAKEEEIYNKRMASYRESLAKYQKRKAVYDEQFPKYQQAKVEYQSAYDEWQRTRHHEEIVYRDSMTSVHNEKLRAKFEEEREAYRQQMEAWRAIRDEQLLAFEQEFETVGNIALSDQMLSDYFFEVQNLGWINCDRFYDVPPQDKQLLVVNDQDDTAEKVYLIFEDINSMIRLTKREAFYFSRNIPRSAQVKILGLKLDNGRPMMAITNTRVDAEESYTLDFQPCTLADIRKTMSGIGG